MRLLGVEGEQLGLVRLVDAMRMAEEAEVDLVEIAPTAVPPVCRLMDYGKFKYQEQKRSHDAKTKQKVIQVKEVKFRPGTDDGDYNVKLKNLIRFLEDGDKAKITLRFRGREMAHQEFGYRLLERVKADLESHAQVEAMPKMEGRQMIMILSPRKKAPIAVKPSSDKVASDKPAAPKEVVTKAPVVKAAMQPDVGAVTVGAAAGGAVAGGAVTTAKLE